MNYRITNPNWSKLKTNIKETWDKLSDDDLDVSKQKRQQIVGKIQDQYDLKKEEVENALKNLEIKHRYFLK